MPFTDYGILQLGSFTKGQSPPSPDYIVVGSSLDGFDGAVSNLGQEVIRKEISWSWNGNKPQATAILLTIDAVGSTLNEIGMGVGSSVGSNIWNRELSAIGDKNETFTVTITFDVDYRRP